MDMITNVFGFGMSRYYLLWKVVISTNGGYGGPNS
jgi:hypothetical protein